MFLDQSTIDLDGWGPITIADLDIDLAWKLFEAASDARQRAIEHATATRSRSVQSRQNVPTFEFAVTGDGGSLGEVIYGICEPCRVGLLYKIEFPPDWQFCGLGRLALDQLETRHPELTWYTTDHLRLPRVRRLRCCRWGASSSTATLAEPRVADADFLAGFLPMRVCYDLAEVQRARGNLDGALATYRQALEVSARAGNQPPSWA